MFDLLHDEDWSLDCRCCLHFSLLSNPHVSNKVLMLMMMIVRNNDNCILNNTAPVPWPTPLTRVASLDSLSPVLSLTDVCGSWQTPLSWSHHLSPHWTSLWARDSAQSSWARVTSSYSHCELSLPSAGDQISGLDHFVDGSEFRTRDLILQNVEYFYRHFIQLDLLFIPCWTV